MNNLKFFTIPKSPSGGFRGLLGLGLLLVLLLFSLAATAQPRKSRNAKNDYTRVYAGISAGAGRFGTVWIGDAKGYSLLIDAEGAYFFNKMFGAGLKFNSAISKINVKDAGAVGTEIISFLGPAAYWRFGFSSFVFMAGAGAGVLKGTFIRDYHNHDYDYGQYRATLGGFVSAGGSYMITRNIGAGITVQATAGSMKTGDFKRNPTAMGYTAGIIFNF